MRRLGVIDLGSNTFHLLIVEHDSGLNFKILFRKRIFTSLSEGGIEHILPSRIDAGLKSIKEFKYNLDLYHCNHLRAIGTAVLRTASNRKEFIDKAEEILCTKIEIIDGASEANYIFKGITLSPLVGRGTHLIMDIGGGSTEFILIREGQAIFSKSYVIGVGALYAMFHKSEPISSSEINQISRYIYEKIADLKSMVDLHKPEFLIGASGSFEVLPMISGYDLSETEIMKVEPKTFLDIYHKIISADEISRSNIEGLPRERIKLIVVGMILKKVIFDLMQPSHIYVSPFGLKEGVLREMFT